MTRFLVTGGAGYIGSILCEELLAEGHSVTVIDDFRYKQISLGHLCCSRNLEVLVGDVRDRRLMSELYDRHDVIVPLAAIVGAPACERDPQGVQAIHVDVIKHMVNALSQEQLVIYPVTNSGYGIGEQGNYCTETSPLRPISLYGKTKVEAEKIVADHSRFVSFRLATVFGSSPRMRLDLLVNDFVYRALFDRFIVLFESHFKRNYIHVRDVANAFLFAFENIEIMKNNVFNLGLSSANLSKKELCELIKSHLPDFHVLESELGSDPDKRDYIVSNEKIESMGWRPEYDLDAGIDELIKVYRMIGSSRGLDNL